MGTMPEQVREVYDSLSREVSYLHLGWIFYRQLFGTSPERIDLLNRFAPAIFRGIQDTMLDGVILGISRLTDPPKTGRQNNLVLERLVKAVKADDEDLPTKLELDSLLERVRSDCRVFREIRNKRIAHNDLQENGNRRADPLVVTSANRQNIEDALAAIRDLLNAVQGHYLDTETRYDYFITGPGDGEALVHAFQELAERREETPRHARPSKRGNHGALPP